MGHQIIKQPDGKLCVFSSATDSIIVTDATPEELIEMYAEDAAVKARHDAKWVIDAVQAGEPRKVYHQFAMTYEEAVAMHEWSEAGSPECGPEAMS